MLNAFTVDVEDYFQVSAFERAIDRREWDSLESRVVDSTDRLLGLLAEHQVRGTFFVLGWVADKHPDLVRRIDAAGHEIGSHSYWHRLVYRQTPGEFRADLIRSIQVLEDITGRPVTTYRAPSFSITRQSLWALDILAECGVRIDSSVFPIRHDRYGIRDANPVLHRVATAHGDLWEFPAATSRVGRFQLPVSGGGYFRLYPFRFTKICLAAINRKRRQPFVFYTHPWEIDAAQPRLGIGSRLTRFRHYVGLRRTYSKLHRLLKSFRFGTVSEVIAEAERGDQPWPGGQPRDFAGGAPLCVTRSAAQSTGKFESRDRRP